MPHPLIYSSLTETNLSYLTAGSKKYVLQMHFNLRSSCVGRVILFLIKVFILIATLLLEYQLISEKKTHRNKHDGAEIERTTTCRKRKIGLS